MLKHYASQELSKEEQQQAQQAYQPQPQSLLQHGPSHGLPYESAGSHRQSYQPTESYRQISSQQILPDVRQQSFIPQHALHQPQMPQLGQPQIPVGYQTQSSRKRRRHEEGDPPSLDYGFLQGQAQEGQMHQRILQSPHTHTSQPPISQSGFQLPQLSQHHHHLPSQITQAKIRRTGTGDVYSPGAMTTGPASVVGQPGMPEPAPQPRGPKLKFTPEDDQKLVDLKENKNLTWKQIADFFPGRSSGTLQVRYCTKLKAKATVWTDDSIRRLRKALRDYEHDRWRIVSSKVGSGFTPAACKEKAEELPPEPAEEE
ncbi:MAG: hypothetical protein M1834_009417 [Cirrosporium novae-zelandiae]|nr:MAG: hypothetical protein M1834_009417 [Cirrosporium novae-zelandiae]